MSQADRSCDSAGCENRATVHLTQVVDNQALTQYLCRACAEAKGVGPLLTPDEAIMELVSQVVDGASQQEGGESGRACDFCGQTAADFKESGRMGCPECYTSFETLSRRLLRRIHGSSEHVGKVYVPPDPEGFVSGRQMADLGRRLERAIEAEDFERAAVLRDQIRGLAVRG